MSRLAIWAPPQSGTALLAGAGVVGLGGFDAECSRCGGVGVERISTAWLGMALHGVTTCPVCLQVKDEGKNLVGRFDIGVVSDSFTPEAGCVIGWTEAPRLLRVFDRMTAVGVADLPDEHLWLDGQQLSLVSIHSDLSGWSNRSHAELEVNVDSSGITAGDLALIVGEFHESPPEPIESAPTVPGFGVV